MTRSRLLFIAVLLVAAVGTLLLWRGRGGARPVRDGARATPATVVVTRGDLAAVVEATGQVSSRQRARLSLPVGGPVAELFVEVGDVVAAGAPLLALDPSELVLRRDEARAALAAAEARRDEVLAGATPAEIEAAQAQLRAAQLALSVAEAEMEALPEAEQGESDEAVAVEQARAGVEQARAALRRLIDGPTPEERAGLEAQVAQARVRLEQAEAAIEAATLRAPFGGTVAERLVSVGERVNPSQPLLALADMGALYVVAEVDEVDVGRVEVGQTVTVTLDAFPTRPLPGEVTRIAPAATTARGAISYATDVRFDPGTLPLRLDMAADLRIRTADAEDVLLLPLDAIRYAEAQPFVVVRREGGAVEQLVTLGAQDERQVVVLEGVEEGDVVELP